MMSLTVDVNLYDIAEKVININILKQIEDDLDIDEKISILFLITEDYTDAFKDIFNLFKKSKIENTYIITDYIKNYSKNSKNWEDKVLEALCILNNREVIKKLGLLFHNLNLKYIPKIRFLSRNINVIAKCLYEVCECLDGDEQKLLLNNVRSEISTYEPLLDNIDHLELHMLYWMQIKYIIISKDEKHNIRKLLKHLERFEDLKIICIDLEKFENHLYVDTHGTFTTNDRSYFQSIFLEKPSLMEGYEYKKNIRSVNSGLCIIINQMYFGKEYETRFGTNADCTSLSETFETFGFKICAFNNLKKVEMLKQIKDIPKNHSNKYDCLFLCILSHGYKGGVIASDEEEVSLEAIEKSVCCKELKDVIKIVIIQACQGKTRGSITNHLRTDGLSDSFLPRTEDVGQFSNFFMFMSTIQGFASIRHKEQGSWFIQEVCKILKTYASQLTFLQCIREIMTSVRKKKGIMEGNQVAQLSEIRQDRLNSDFQLNHVFVSDK